MPQDTPIGERQHRTDEHRGLPLATGTRAGYMSAEDKAKLDLLGVSSGATPTAPASSPESAAPAVHANLLGLSADDHSQYDTPARGALLYAPLAKGVTNGDNHNHAGGDGAQIGYDDLSGKPTLGTAAAHAVDDFMAAGSALPVATYNAHHHATPTPIVTTSEAEWNAGTRTTVDTATTPGSVVLGGSAGPASDSYTKLMLHMDGANHSTTFTDSEATPKTVTANGAAEISTAGAGKFDQSGWFAGSNSYLSVPDSDDWDFGSGDFTIDWWEGRTGDGGESTIIARDATTTYTPWIVGTSFSGSTVQCFISSNGSSWDIASAKSMGTRDLNTWNHYALVRSGTTFTTYKNGARVETWESSASIYASSAALSIGRSQNTYYYTGYIDELRVSKGVARWTGASFTPPTAAYAATTYTTSGTDIVNYDSGASGSPWKVITWAGTTPTGTLIKARSRSAETQAGLSGATWSSYYTTSGSAITSAAGRWLQVEWRLETTDTYATPTLTDGTVTYQLATDGAQVTKEDVTGLTLADSPAFGGTACTIAGDVAGTTYPYQALRRARGTIASPTDVTSSDSIGALWAYPYAGGYLLRAGLLFREDGTVDAATGTAPTAAVLYTGTAALAERMRVTSAGLVGIGIATPYSLLDVAGATGAVLTLTRSDISVTAADVIGTIQWRTTDTQTTSNPLAASIAVTAQNTIATDINPGDMVFAVTGTGAGGAQLVHMEFKPGTAAQIGFFGVTPVARPTAYTQTYSTASKTVANLTAATLTDNTGGSADTTLAAVEATYTQATIRNNFADLAAMINKLTADVLADKKVITAVIDDLQALGLAQ